MSRARNVALWLLTAMLAFVFLFSGAFKLSGAQQGVDNFHKWGYPDWFRIVTGVIEAGGAVLLLIPRTAWVSAVVLSCTMIGAVATHIHSSEFGIIPLPGTLLVLLLVLGWARRPQMASASAAPSHFP